MAAEPTDLDSYRAHIANKQELVGEKSAALVGAGGGPHDPGMEQRVATLETDMKEVKATLGRIETTLGRVHEGIKHLATKTELVAVTGAVSVLSANVTALDGRVVKVETAVNDAVKTALAKSIGPVQAVSMLAGAIAVLIAAGGLVNWLMVRGFFPR